MPSINLRDYQTDARQKINRMIIYKAINIINGKIYIGQTSVSLTERIGDHRRKAKIHNSKSSFHSAIRKYGINNFRFEIIDNAKDRDELNYKEKYWIKFYNSNNNKIGYNLKTGGDQPTFNDEVKKKIGLAGKGRKLSEECINNMRIRFTGKGNPFYGKRHTTETKNKISQTKKSQKKKHTLEHIERCKHIGEDNATSKLKNCDVIKIKTMLKNNIRIIDISKKLKINKSSIKNIKYGNCWNHIKI